MVFKDPFQPIPFYDSMISLTQMEDVALGLVKLHEVHMGPFLNRVKVPLKPVRVL